MLGQELFGNAGCTTTAPALSDADRASVARLHEVEQQNCRLDTSRGPTAQQREIHANVARLIDRACRR